MSSLLRIGQSTFVLTLEGDLDRDALDMLRDELGHLVNRHVIVDLLDVYHVGPEAIAVLGDAGRVGIVTIVADRRTSDALHRAEAGHLRVHAALSDAVAEALT